MSISNYMFEELQNWRRWCLSLGSSNGHCRSLEHRYMAESDLSREVKPSILVRNDDAVRIEIQLSSLTFPKKQRRLIINEYIWKRPYQRTCKELGVSFKDYNIEIERAVNILENRLNFAIDRKKEQVYIKEKLAELATFT